MQNRKRNAEQKGRAAMPLIAGVSGGVLMCFLLLSVMAFVLCKVDVPSELLTPITTVITALSALTAGLIFAMLYGEKGMLFGFLIGLAFFAVLWLAALIQGQTELTPLLLIKCAALVLSGAVGGGFGISLREKRRRVH